MSVQNFSKDGQDYVGMILGWKEQIMLFLKTLLKKIVRTMHLLIINIYLKLKMRLKWWYGLTRVMEGFKKYLDFWEV